MNQTKSTDKKHSIIGKWVLLLVFFTFGFSEWADVDVEDSFTSTGLKIFIESTTFGLSPMLVSVFSPANFKSWGISPMTDPWNILQFSPINVLDLITAKFSMLVPDPIVTPFSICTKGPMLTFSPKSAPLCTMAVGWMEVEINLPSYIRSTILAIMSAWATNLSST